MSMHYIDYLSVPAMRMPRFFGGISVPSRASRCAALLYVLVAAGLLCGEPQTGGPPTRLRSAHRIFIFAHTGEDVSGEVVALSASIGYPDSLAYILWGPTGRVLRSGSLAPGKRSRLKFRADVTGIYVLDANPGNNAFTFDAPGANWVIAPDPRSRKISVIWHARRLYFFVPEKLNEFTLALGGAEAAKVSIIRPDGEVAANVSLEYVKPRHVTVAVGGDGGKSWSLALDLQEDLPITLDAGIPPYLSERPLSLADIETFQAHRPRTFDLQPMPRASGPATAEAGLPKATLKVSRELELVLSSVGRIVGVWANDKNVYPKGETPFSGFLLRDKKRSTALWPARGSLRKSGNQWRLICTSRELSLRLDVSFTPAEDHIALEGTLKGLSDEDRAISLYFTIPVARDGAVWWDDIDRKTPVEAGMEYSNWDKVNAGANGRHSVYPFACVAGRGGVAMGVPMDRPALHRLGYNADTQQLFLCFDFALTLATAKFPSAAPFRFVIYPVDPKWGFRSAADRYYRIYPQFFEKRAPDGGMLCSLGPVSHRDAGKRGFAYQWAAASVKAVSVAHKAGLLPLLYNDSMRYFIFLSMAPEVTPSRKQQAEDMEAFLKARDPQRLYLQRPEVVGRVKKLNHWMGMTFDEFCAPAGRAYLRALNQSVERSAFHDRGGRFIPTYYNSARYDLKHYGYNIHTARILCDPDPDIPGGFGEFLLNKIIGRRFKRMEAHGTRYEGVALDNYFVNGKDVDYRREHFAYADYPLTFAADGRPVLLGDFCLYEFTKALAQRLRSNGQCISANTCVMSFPFAMAWIDVNLFEWNIGRKQAIARTLAYHRPVVTLPMRKQHYEDLWVRHSHLRFGFFPGGYRSTPDNPKVMRVYGRYVPALKRLAAAGWEPLTYASANDPNVMIERFGSWEKGILCFSVLNRSRVEKQITMALDVEALGIKPATLKGAVVKDLVDTARAASPMDPAGAFQLTLRPGEVVAIEVARPGA